MNAATDFHELQRAFAAHLRDPARHPAPPDIEDRRLKIYRELFFNNVESLLAKNFPVISKLLAGPRWIALARDFYREHQAHTPLFPELAREFLQYLQARREAGRGDPDFLLELAHYEWVELALDIDDTNLDAIACNPAGDLVSGKPVVSPLAWLLSYAYPVHRIRADFQPDAPGEAPTLLVVVRDRHDRVGFMELNAVSARLLALLAEPECSSGESALRQIATELQSPDPERIVAFGRELLENFRARDVLLGSAR